MRVLLAFQESSITREHTGQNRAAVLTRCQCRVRVISMAKALEIDKDMVKSFYLKGMQPSEIASLCGVSVNTICQWSIRYGWREEKTIESASKPVVLDEVVNEFANRAIAIARKVMVSLEKGAIRGHKDAKEVAQALSAAYASFRKAANLDDATVQRHLHVHVMRGKAAQVGTSVDAPTIDVPSEPAPQSVPECPTES